MTNPQYFVAVPVEQELPKGIGDYPIITTDGYPCSAGFDTTGWSCEPWDVVTHWLRPAPEVEAMQAQMDRMRNALEDVKTSIRAAAHTEMDSAGRYPTGAEVATRLAHSKLYQTITSALEAGKIEK